MANIAVIAQGKFAMSCGSVQCLLEVLLFSGEAFDYLDGPVLRVTGVDVPMPYSGHLEHAALPQIEDVIHTVKRSLNLLQ